MALDYADGGRDVGKPDRLGSSDWGSSIERSKSAQADRPGHILAPGELAHTERAQTLRAMVAARGNAPKLIAESMREAIAAAKAAAQQDTSRSMGASKTSGADRPGHVLAPEELAHTDRAKELRAMVAAVVNAPKQTPESFREALAAAAKAMPQQDRSYEKDYGAER